MTFVQVVEGGPIQLVRMEWARGLENSGILSPMHMPHFGRMAEVDTCVKQLLVYFHGGCLWLDRRISVVVDLIIAIVGLPTAQVDPTSFFVRTEKDPGLADQMKEKYNLSTDKRGFFISSINDTIVQFIAKLL